MKYAFYAIFSPDEQSKGAINVVFPDILGAYTFGMGEEDAMAMAKDLLGGLMDLEEFRNIKPKQKDEINASNGKVLLVEVEK